MNKLFTYDNICLIPKYSELNSRTDADPSTTFLETRVRLPVIPATMKDVISIDVARFLYKAGYYYIMHRFDYDNILEHPKSQMIDFLDIAYKENWTFVSICIGTKNYETLLNKYIGWEKINTILIDVAHCHSKLTEDVVNWVKKKFPNAKLIAGNIATKEAYTFLYNLGVDGVKVGIGGGKICTTRHQTGFHLPTAYSVYECASVGLDLPIIADGGISSFGDIAKSLTLGADMVMCGKLFAECIDSPAKMINGKKVYRGSTSFEAKQVKDNVEGITLELDQGVTYQERLEEIKQALCSSISYAGGKDLNAFKTVKWEIL
jgi:GMP reductase